MNLREYLKKSGVSIQRFSERANITRPYLSEILNGRAPSKKLSIQIYKETGGEVTVEELRVNAKPNKLSVKKKTDCEELEPIKKEDPYDQYELPFKERFLC